MSFQLRSFGLQRTYTSRPASICRSRVRDGDRKRLGDDFVRMQASSQLERIRTHCSCRTEAHGLSELAQLRRREGRRTAYDLCCPYAR